MCPEVLRHDAVQPHLPVPCACTYMCSAVRCVMCRQAHVCCTLLCGWGGTVNTRLQYPCLSGRCSVRVDGGRFHKPSKTWKSSNSRFFRSQESLSRCQIRPGCLQIQPVRCGEPGMLAPSLQGHSRNISQKGLGCHLAQAFSVLAAHQTCLGSITNDECHGQIPLSESLWVGA